MEPGDFKGTQDVTNRRFRELGVVVSMRDDKLIIISPMEDDTPGFKPRRLGQVFLNMKSLRTDEMNNTRPFQLGATESWHAHEEDSRERFAPQTRQIPFATLGISVSPTDPF